MRWLSRALVQGSRFSDCRRCRNQMPTLSADQLHTALEPQKTDCPMSSRRDQALWTYVPRSCLKRATSGEFRSALDMPGSTSAFISPSRPIELWLSSSGKATRRPLSWPGWKTKPWLKRLSGTTLDPLTAALGVDAFISSLPAIPANPSAMPGSAAAMPTRVTCGPKSRGLSTKPRQSGCGAKTSTGICNWDTPTSPLTFDEWATRQRRACSLRERLAQATDGVGCSSWPTLTASDAGYVPELALCGGQVRPMSPHDIGPTSGGQFALGEAARAWTTFWLALRAVGFSAKHATSPSSLPVRLSFKNGKSSFHATLMPNPQFYEMMMGWPIGWTAPGEPVTAYTAWLRRSRGLFSSLLTNFNGEAALGG